MMFLLSLCLATVYARNIVPDVNMTEEAAASCDPDYGWINGPDGTNKCYMVLKVGFTI